MNNETGNNETRMRVIRVTGKGRLQVKPDMTRITVNLTGVCREYGETLRRSSRDTERLRELLTGFGFERSELKTLKFNVDTKYESYKVGDVYRQRLVGYEFEHRLKVEFPSDNERLGKIVYALANCPLAPEFFLSYTVRDAETVKNQLLGKAVRDAQQKAAVLTQAAGLSLRDIQSMDYSWIEVDFETRPMGRSLLLEECEEESEINRYDLDIEPDDIDVSDTVTVVWEIA